MRRLLSMILALAITLMSASGALAVRFTGELGNEATFETLQEAHENAPGVVRSIYENGAKTFVGHPALAEYPQNTTYIYRSANQYAGRAAARLNTNIIVYAEQRFVDKAAALNYLKTTGVIDIIEECTGSVVLVTPVGEAFGAQDVKPYYALQTAMLAQKDSGKDENGNTVYYADAEYFGGYGYVYFVGIDGGATFFNNYLSTEVDFAGRIAGALLIGGDMQEIRKPAVIVPVYQINGKEEIIEKYKAINEINAEKRTANAVTYYNQAWPLRQVVAVQADNAVVAEQLKAAYYGMFIKAQRVPVLPQAIHSGGTPFSGYNFDEAPYSLCNRTTVINGRTESGVCMIAHQMDDNRFAAIKTTQEAQNMDGSVTPAGEYIDVWYEYLPQEVLDGTAPTGSVPLILANHGGGDDARVFVEEFGLLDLAGKERIALVAPDHQLIGEVRGEALTAIVDYMLQTYPALDASRVYATGYSMGGGATYTVGYYNPGLFAAIAPCAGSPTPIPQEQIANFDHCQLPIMFTITSFDGVRRLDALEGNLNPAEQEMVSFWTKANGIQLPAFDFEAYPHFGAPGDACVIDTVNDEFEKVTWYMNNQDGEQRAAFVYIKGMIHALYPEYANIIWDFLKDYSRDLETGSIVYNPHF